MYGHTAFRVKFYSGKTIETGFVVENFDQQQSGKSKGKSPVYLEMYDTNSSQAMSRRREFKLEYAVIQFTPEEKIKFIQNLNDTITNGTGEMTNCTLTTAQLWP